MTTPAQLFLPPWEEQAPVVYLAKFCKGPRGQVLFTHVEMYSRHIGGFGQFNGSPEHGAYAVAMHEEFMTLGADAMKYFSAHFDQDSLDKIQDRGENYRCRFVKQGEQFFIVAWPRLTKRLSNE